MGERNIYSEQLPRASTASNTFFHLFQTAFNSNAAGARSPLVDWALVHRALVWAAAGAATDLVDLVLV